MLSLKKTGIIAGIVIFVILCAIIGYNIWFKPTKILVVNPLPAQEAEIVLNNDSRHIKVVCRKMEEATDFDKYDAVLMYGRGLYLDSLQLASIEKAANKGIPVFTNTLRNFSFVVSHNIDSIQTRTLQSYFSNACSKNYRNLLRYVRNIATPHRIGDQDYDQPVEMPKNLFYHLEAAKYFETAELLEQYLKETGLYIPDGDKVAFISGVSFPVENNRAHVDTLVSRLTQSGYNVFPITATGKSRAKLIKSVKPDAIVYLPMGRLGNDTLINWAYDNKIPMFMPFPLVQPREEWLDINNPMSAGTLNARIVVPEIDGGMTPLCISTQNKSPEGFLLYTPEKERVDAFIEQFSRFMNLKKLPNSDKKVAIGYFKTPGKDALLASGMEVIPSLYNFLKRLAAEGYDVSGLPDNLERFKQLVMTEGIVPGDYAHMAQQKILETTHPVWIDKKEYEGWAKKTLLLEKYKEVEERYGKAPGQLMARGDSIAIAGLTFGNVFIFPQPRPALGDDDFKLVHGAEVAPPHSYIAPYLYVSQKFNADALIHFGTHGNLEFTPGKNAGLSQADWAEVLVGNRPHFYFYTTGNVGEAIIAKRRSHAVIVTHLTPPYVESGLRQKYNDLIERLHQAIANPKSNTLSLKKEIISNGFDKDLGLESPSDKCYSAEQLKKIDAYVEELANEKITGAYYVMGVPYSNKDMVSSVIAMTADRIAYDNARKDFEKGIISKDNLQDFTYIAHHYVPKAKTKVLETLNSGKASSVTGSVLETKHLLTESAGAEINAMVSALNGVPVRPAPGGDPVRNPNVLPMGRNMYNVNAEATPGKDAWNTGVTLAENTVKNYLSSHGEYPRKVSYTFWAGEFISSEGASIAHALRMLGVEPIWDEQGRVMDLKLTPSEELGRPRINIMVQVSGQLRDIAGSRLKMLTDAVKLGQKRMTTNIPTMWRKVRFARKRNSWKKGSRPNAPENLRI